MIRSLADLLDAMRDRELQALEPFGAVKHGPMIGDMYEGLTKEILRQTLFLGLDIRVVDGKVRWADGRMSGQIDCMIVVGEGERLPYTDHWLYSADQVIAAISVKKRLYTADLQEAHENLLSVLEGSQYDMVNIPSVQGAYRTVCRRDIPTPSEYESRPLHDREILGSLVSDVEAPLRVVIGYDGFSTEAGLREGFVDYVFDNVSGERNGFAPHAFPNLILCGEHALLRLNGMPFGPGLVDSPPNYDEMALATPFPGIPGPQEWWPWIASTSGVNSHLLLEVLWTRLSYRFAIGSQIFGDDLTVERLTPLLLGKAAEVNGRIGWYFLGLPVASERSLRANRVEDAWEPVEITPEHATFLQMLGEEGRATVGDSVIEQAAAEASMTADEYVTWWVATGLLYVDDAHRLKWLTTQCDTAFLPGGRIVAGDNFTGRLTRWSEREMHCIHSKKLPSRPGQ